MDMNVLCPAVISFLLLAYSELCFGKAPKFCKGLGCPEFTILKKTKDYQLREYEPSRWVSTGAVGLDYREASTKNFHKLFDYISGQNVKKEKIAMTAPVINKVIPGQGPACESNFTMSFFVAGSNKGPAPTNKEVSLNRFNSMKVYVRSFSGYAMTWESYRKEFLKLEKAINDPSKYDSSYLYTAGYDSPFTVFNRHNEVWLLAKDSTSDSTLYFSPSVN